MQLDDLPIEMREAFESILAYVAKEESDSARAGILAAKLAYEAVMDLSTDLIRARNASICRAATEEGPRRHGALTDLARDVGLSRETIYGALRRGAAAD